MLSAKIQESFNDQLNAETYSAYLYLSMAAYFDSLNLSGFSNWMQVQAREEMIHAMKFYNYINDRGGRVILSAVEAPETEWDSPQAAFEHTLEHEQKVTSLINGLVDMAESEKDRASLSFLQWFVDEQVEEEASADAVLKKIELVREAPGGILMIDQELAQRVFTPPAGSGGE